MILAASLAGPLLLSFDKKVHFYRKWKFLFPAMLLPALFYITWDMWFTKMGVWAFNPMYITGIKVYNLPIEEVLFFFVVPYCCVFIYECIRCYFPKLEDSVIIKNCIPFFIASLLITAIIFFDRYYTGYTFLFLGLFLAAFLLFRKQIAGFHVTAFFLSYAIILVPFLIVNGFLTSIPVVIYNDFENLGVRIHTIPVEDIFYGMLLVFLNVFFYEQARSRTVVTEK
jgi:lycopene cyclase domain-containing protein